MTLSHIILGSLIRGIDLAGMILLAGGSVFRTLVVPVPSGRNSPLERSLPFLLLVIGLADLVLRSMMISGHPLSEVWVSVPAVLIKSHFGKVWMVRMFLLCLLGMTSIIKTQGRIKEGLAITAGALLLLTASLSGHAADSGDLSLAVLADWLHLLAVSAWMGGLFFLASVLRGWIASRGSKPEFPALIASLTRFSALAGGSVALILATGSYQFWRQVGSAAALLQTAYGQTLIVKLLLVLPLLGLGAINRYRVLPRLSRHALARNGPKRLLNVVTLEMGFGLAILVCISLLIQLPPARSQWASAYKVSTHTMSHSHHGETSPSNLKPAEGASVKILSPKEGQLFKGDEVPFQFKLVKGKRGSHVHAYVDGELMGMFQSEKGTLTGIKPGTHTLEVRVVAEDHQTELDASDKARFVVK